MKFPYLFDLLLQCRDPDPYRRLQALNVLENNYVDQVKVEFLLLLLNKAESYEEQSAVLRIIGLLGSRVPVTELLAILADQEAPDWTLRYLVAGTLAGLGKDAPVGLFIQILQDQSEDSNLRARMAGLLGAFGERVELDVLIAAARDDDPDVCASAIRSLIKQGKRAPLDPILAQMNHSEAEVRKAAIQALSSAGERAPIEPIVAALSDPDPQVRETAVRGMNLLLEWFGVRVPLAPLFAAIADEYPPVRETALDVLSNHPESVPLESVVTALSDRNEYVRCAALLVLERIGTRVPEDVHHLVQGMCRTDSCLRARRSATRALLTMKGMELADEERGVTSID